MSDRIELDYAIESIMPRMGVDLMDGEMWLDARQIERKYGEPYAKLHEVFGPIAEERELEIIGVEQHEGAKTEMIGIWVGRVLRTFPIRIRPDAFWIRWQPKAGILKGMYDVPSRGGQDSGESDRSV